MKPGSIWICAWLVGCGSSAPAPNSPATPEPAEEPPATTEAAAPREPAPPPAPDTRSLFERLGGTPAITAVVDEFVTRTTTDPRIKFRFLNTDAVTLKRLLVEFVGQATGGSVVYSGRDMASSHAGMELVDEEFTALVEDLVGALDKFHVPEREKGEPLGALGPLKPLMVVGAGKLRPVSDASLAPARALAGTLSDPMANELLAFAVTAARRGQRSYAEQLFMRAELIVGAQAVANAAGAFRDGAPPRIQTAVTVMKDTAPQPKAAVGRSEEDTPVKRVERGSLRGTLQLEGKPLDGIGLVMLWPKAGGGAKRTPKFRVVEQRGKSFAPHLMAVPVGSTVAFPNFDAIYHNVFSLSTPQRFDLGMYKSGETRQVVFDKPGVVRVGCNIHANMSAYVVVVDAPYYVVSEADGSFSFRSLKPGKYKVSAWSERSAAPVVTELTVKAGVNKLALDLKGGAPVGPTEDKFGVPRSP